MSEKASTAEDQGGTLKPTATPTRLQRLRRTIWGPPPSSPQEARLIFKIDCLVMTFTCLMYWSNYLNRTNFQNAYVSGMSEDVHFHGNQYSVVNTLFTVGYILGMIPNILLLQIISPHIWLPLVAAIWSALSMCLAAVSQPSHVMGIRFLQGVIESSTFSGGHYIYGSWYTDGEIGKRSGIFASSAQLGSLFSGVLQGAIHKNLNGYRGLQSWKWLFLIDGFIGIPIALYGFVFFPDVPRRARKWILTEEERRLAVERLPKRQQTSTKIGWSLFRRVLKRWHWYAFSALFAWSSMLESVGSNGLFQLWLQAEGYSIRRRNVSGPVQRRPLFNFKQLNVFPILLSQYWPLALQAVAITSTLLCATLTDIRSIPRWTVNLFMSLTLLFVSIVLLNYHHIPFGLQFTAFTLSGVGYAGQASNFAWANVVCAADEQERAVVIASMNLWSNVVQAWWSIVFYAADLAPTWTRGWIAMICVCVLTTVIALVVRYLDRREVRGIESGVLTRHTDGDG